EIANYLKTVEQSLRVPLTGYALQEGSATGFWHDGWIGSTFDVNIRVEEAIHSLIVRGYIPEGAAQEKQVSLLVNGETVAQQKASPGFFSAEARVEKNAGERFQLGIRSTPAGGGIGGDQRDLAILLQEIRVLHGSEKTVAMGEHPTSSPKPAASAQVPIN